MTRPTMIFHVPFPLDADGKSASAIRPVRMRAAFETAGYDVLEISGYSADRRRLIKQLRAEIRQGRRISFVYSEGSTMPTAFTDPHHLPLHPRMDLDFLRFCRRQGIRVGVFYRDIYWQFPEYLASLNPLLARVMRFFYKSDLRRYQKSVDKIFLPSQRMAAYLPAHNRAQAVSLPPGSEVVDSPTPQASPISLLFVGGLGAYYRLHQCIQGVEQAADAHLVICTREEQWAAVREEYDFLIGAASGVVHRSGTQLESLYAAAHVGTLFLEPIEYREFAAPLKMYEYLGHGKPIIAAEGSLVADFVRENGVGWVLPYHADALTELLNDLASHPSLLAAMREKVLVVREEHTWVARASQAADVLSGDNR